MHTVTKTNGNGCDSTLRTEIQTPQTLGLTYSLIETPAYDNSGSVFSILCTLQGEDGDDYDFAYDVSRTRERASEILRLLCAGTVTPCTLKYVISDLIA